MAVLHVLSDPAAASLASGSLDWLEYAVETATGWPGVALIAVYSFLISAVLPLPSEVVLLPVGSLDLGIGLGSGGQFVVVVLVSGVAKAAGSLVAFHVGQEAKQAGPIIRALRRSRFDVVEWSENKTVDLARQWGYFGLALALSVPGFPDTLSIYAFSILEDSYSRFALATFAGSVGRLLITAGAGAVIAFTW